MATMGQPGTINITQEMMDNAIRAIADYQQSVTSINKELEGVITALITPSTFSGNAANGFNSFYEDNIKINVEENLTNMLKALTEICETIKKQIPGNEEGVDDQLGSGNRGAGENEQ